MHLVGETRSGLLVQLDVQAICGEGNSEAEVDSKQLDEWSMLGSGVRSVGADKSDPTREFVQGCRDCGIAPHVACVRGGKTPGLEGRTTRSKAYRTSQRIRKRIEEPFGWRKTAGHFRKTRWRGIDRTPFMAQFFGSACNLLRMARNGRHRDRETTGNGGGSLRPPGPRLPGHPAGAKNVHQTTPTFAKKRPPAAV